MIRERIVQMARTYIGTPYHHHGRLKNIGIDCVGLIVGIGKELGLLDEVLDEDCMGYNQYPARHLLLEALNKSSLVLVDAGHEQIGDVFTFRMHPKVTSPQHMAIRTDKGIIHVHAGIGTRKVVEHNLDVRWKRRFCGAFKYRGVV